LTHVDACVTLAMTSTAVDIWSTGTEQRMSRIQLALNVDDLDAAVEFYSRLFQAQPAKRREGYANFAITEPPLKLVLIEKPGEGGTLNHLGVEVFSTEEVAAASARLAGEGLETLDQQATTCCYATQDKVWVTDPSGARWEVYTVLDDSPVASDPACCAPSDTDSRTDLELTATTSSVCC
jgi:catechol 2,3-dioxygenase-like lactoylglutathione lyase family enzyme